MAEPAREAVRRAVVRTVLSWSVQRLSGDTAEAFRRLGLHPGADTDPYATAALIGTDAADARHRLDVLAAMAVTATVERRPR